MSYRTAWHSSAVQLPSRTIYYYNIFYFVAGKTEFYIIEIYDGGSSGVNGHTSRSAVDRRPARQMRDRAGYIIVAVEIRRWRETFGNRKRKNFVAFVKNSSAGCEPGVRGCVSGRVGAGWVQGVGGRRCRENVIYYTCTLCIYIYVDGLAVRRNKKHVN